MSMSPDVTHLMTQLSHSFSPDRALRVASGEYLAALPFPQSLPLLLQIGAAPELDATVRQAAGITLKNAIRRHYKDLAKTDPATASQLKASLLDAVVNCTQASLTSFLVEAVAHIATSDFPDLWPEFVPTVQNTLAASCSSGNATQCVNVLVMVRKVLKRYQFKPKEARGPVTLVTAAVYPTVLGLLQYLVQQPISEPTGAMIKQALKVFWSGDQFYLHSYDPAVVQPWLDVLHSVISLQLPPELHPADPEKWVWWKAKKWALQIAVRVFSRFGHPGKAEPGEPQKAMAAYVARRRGEGAGGGLRRKRERARTRRARARRARGRASERGWRERGARLRSRVRGTFAASPACAAEAGLQKGLSGGEPAEPPALPAW
jgi:hypothetical protein